MSKIDKTDSVRQMISKIDSIIDEIWNKPPDEINNLLEVEGPFRQSFNLVIYSFWDTNALASTLWIIRCQMKEGISMENLAGIVSSIIAGHAKSYEAYGLTDTAALFEEVSTVVAGIEERTQLLEIIEKLIVYLNRLGMAGWLDTLIPWKEMGDAFDNVMTEKKKQGISG